ncbi:MAG TPA: mannose-1-phosphate guanylyltransferase/mannose-6-phosphate isomerase [Rhabdochlamydiaceae bacterium]|jgi:mannose-1-phosphate guanylyltransferase/mannose-6-phosphate isomerase
MKIVILAGGSGMRLWPYSRTSLPKQFLHFGEKHSLLQKTILRYFTLVPFSDMLIVTSQIYYHLVKAQIKEVDPTLSIEILIEPEKKNTAPAIALAVSYLLKKGCPQTQPVLIASSDHHISPESRFIASIPLGLEYVQRGKNVIFGIRPHKPETGYGYIQADKDANVEFFVEKPDYSQARHFLLSGNYLWNSGIFLFSIGALLEEFAEHCPAIGNRVAAGLEEMIAEFSQLPDISIDYALMEKSRRTSVISLDVSWSDVGSWDSVYDILDKDENHNVKMGNVYASDTKNCLIMGTRRLISTLGLEDMLIIETDDVLFIGKKGQSQKVKQLVEELKSKNVPASVDHVTSHRPWGKFTVLEEGERYKIKHIAVDPLQKLSLQKHYHRSEHWVVIKGTAKVTLGDREKIIHENESIFVPKGEVHRLENPGKVQLELIEVQVGEYVGEDDIVRLEDIYERIGT